MDHLRVRAKVETARPSAIAFPPVESREALAASSSRSRLDRLSTS